MKVREFMSLLLAVALVFSLAACGKNGVETETAKRTNGAHESITIMSANKDYSGFMGDARIQPIL